MYTEHLLTTYEWLIANSKLYQRYEKNYIWIVQLVNKEYTVHGMKSNTLQLICLFNQNIFFSRNVVLI